jgi:hypothetical protein
VFQVHKAFKVYKVHKVLVFKVLLAPKAQEEQLVLAFRELKV